MGEQVTKGVPMKGSALFSFPGCQGQSAFPPCPSIMMFCVTTDLKTKGPNDHRLNGTSEIMISPLPRKNNSPSCLLFPFGYFSSMKECD